MTYSNLPVVSMLPSGVLSLCKFTFVFRKAVLGVNLMELAVGSHPCLTWIKDCPKCRSRPFVPLYFLSFTSCRAFV